jgi:hypothetical protein
MDFLPLPDNAARQLIDSITVFDEYMRVQAQARRYSGGMYWKRQGDYEYLVRTAPDTGRAAWGPAAPKPRRRSTTSSAANAKSKPDSSRCAKHETAINARGFEVDFLRRQPEEDDPHLFRFSDDENDLWPVQAVRASVLTSAPRFDHVVVSASGRMALMRTIAPASFVEFKRWMAAKAPRRPEAKRRRDLRQAEIVQKLLGEGLLVGPGARAS